MDKKTERGSPCDCYLFGFHGNVLTWLKRLTVGEEKKTVCVSVRVSVCTVGGCRVCVFMCTVITHELNWD